MYKQIRAIKYLLARGINKEMFLLITLNVTNQHQELNPIYANYLNNAGWRNLFQHAHPSIVLTENQIINYFDYMSEYHNSFFGKDQHCYFVNRSFQDNV